MSVIKINKIKAMQTGFTHQSKSPVSKLVHECIVIQSKYCSELLMLWSQYSLLLKAKGVKGILYFCVTAVICYS